LPEHLAERQAIDESIGLAGNNLGGGSAGNLISGPKFLDTDKYDVV
jgi:hypothetical protein